MLDYKKLLASALMFSMIAAASGCDDNSDNNSSSNEISGSISDSTETSSFDSNESSLVSDDEELSPPIPAEASDENTVTFDNDDFSFAEIIADDDTSVNGELSIVEIQGNKMLKFTESGDDDIALADKVQKIKINAAKLIGTDSLDKVTSIEFDVYADATTDELVNEDGENVKAPGWIGGGGGTVTADNDKWYDFSEFGGGEYNFEMSGAVHAQFKFLLAAGGQKWSADMTDANFLIMRWGLQNQSNLYIDNIVFYDENGDSIPLAK